MIRYAKVRDVKDPQRGTQFSAGIDFFVPNDFNTQIVEGGSDILIPSGIIMEIPEHCMLIGVDKSGISSSYLAKIRCGMNAKCPDMNSPIIVGAKLIDADYSGEIHIHLINAGKNPITIIPGMKIAQFVLLPVFYDSCIEVSRDSLFFPKSRGSGGFSSTGI